MGGSNLFFQVLDFASIEHRCRASLYARAGCTFCIEILIRNSLSINKLICQKIVRGGEELFFIELSQNHQLPKKTIVTPHFIV